MKILNRINEIFIDDSGKVSMAKVCIVIFVALISLLVLAYITFAIREFSQTNKIPALPQGLSWVITAIVGGISALYASNKFSPTYTFRRPDMMIDNPDEEA